MVRLDSGAMGYGRRGSARTAGNGPVYGKTKREAQERLRAAQTAADNGIRPVSQRVTVEAHLRAWVEALPEGPNRVRTIDSYRQTVERYILPSIGTIPLAKLEPEDVTRMMKTVRARGVSVTTARYSVAVLRIALNRAMKQGRVLRNVAKLIDLPKPDRQELTPLSGGEARMLVESVTEHRFGPLFTLAIATGMRPGRATRAPMAERGSRRGLPPSPAHTPRGGARPCRDKDRAEQANPSPVPLRIVGAPRAASATAGGPTRGRASMARCGLRIHDSLRYAARRAERDA